VKIIKRKVATTNEKKEKSGKEGKICGGIVIGLCFKMSTRASSKERLDH